MSRVAVMGAGAWGTTLAILCAESGAQTSIWAREEDVCRMIEQQRENRTYLPGIPISPSIRASCDLEEATRNAEVVFLAVPAKFIRNVLNDWKPKDSKTILCSVAKGLEEESGKVPSAIILDVLGPKMNNPLCVLSGPNLSSEIAKGLPAATVVASKNKQAAAAVQSLLMLERFRVYTSEDVAGVEWGGVLKNVIAIAAGIAGGLGLGDNAKSALVTRGLAEMVRFGESVGAKKETFYGLSGLGDLLCTCAGELSRNYRVGVAVAKGKKLNEILSESLAVPEGVFSAKTVVRLAHAKKMEMPISAQVVSVLYEGKGPYQALQQLMAREARPE